MKFLVMLYLLMQHTVPISKFDMQFNFILQIMSFLNNFIVI